MTRTSLLACSVVVALWFVIPEGVEGCSSRRCTRCDCLWGGWSSWGSCAPSRSSGWWGSRTSSYKQTRTRSKTRQEACGGSCSGSSVDTRCCGCSWSNWSAWRCYGSMQKTRSRSAVYNYYTSCSRHCIGSDSQTTTATCEYGNWYPWSSCNVKTGLQWRERRLTSSSLCGANCISAKEECRPCLVNCQWGPWTRWSECERSGSNWERKRTRVKYVTEKNGGSCSGTAVETQLETDAGKCAGLNDVCSPNPCPGGGTCTPGKLGDGYSCS